MLLSHLTPDADPDRGLYSLHFKVAKFGWTGVDLFFVLSGFLITGMLVGADSASLSLRNFFVRRALRIVPVCYLTLLIVFVAVPCATELYALPALHEEWPYWLFLSNYFDLEGAYSRYFGLSHLWSLSVEMQYYLVWPFVVAYVSRRNLVRIVMGGLATAVLLRTILVLVHVSPMITYSWLPTRVDGLLIGSLIALSQGGVVNLGRYRSSLQFLGLVATVIVGYVIWRGLSTVVFKDTSNTSLLLLRIVLPALIGVFYGFALFVALKVPMVSAILSNIVLRLLGKYSYSIYVFHFLLIPLFLLYLKPQLDHYFGAGSDMAVYGYFGSTALTAIGLAVLSYYLLERPMLALKVGFPLNATSQGDVVTAESRGARYEAVVASVAGRPRSAGD